MISFMLASLGSVIFWIVYVLITLFVGLVVMKKIAPDTFESITTGEKGNSIMDWFGYSVITALIFLFWPVILVAFVIAQVWILIVFKMLGPLLLLFFRSIAKLIPDIKISID